MGNIVLDVMGGDNAPGAQVRGAVEAIDSVSSDIYLAGRENEIKALLKGFTHPRLHVINAPQIIKMDDKPAAACRKYPDSSLMKGMRFTREHRDSVFISAGNSGAVVASAVLVLERIPGILRPAIAVVARGVKGPFVILDAGATTNNCWQQLYQFAVMGNICASLILKKDNPRIGLLSNGSEPGKGTDAVVAANKALSESGLNFIGNIEGGDVLTGVCDCVVCDGFVGNILLKLAESFSEVLHTGFHSGSKFSLFRKFGKGFLKKMLRKFDYTEYGATYLLGLNGSVMVTHGRANEKAIANAVSAAEEEIQAGISAAIAEEISKYSDKLDL